MNKFLAAGLGVVAVVLAGYIGVQILGGPPPDAAEPSPSPSTSADLPEGQFVLSHEVGITVTIPAAGWYGEIGTGILRKNDDPYPPDGAGMITFGGELYVYGDPCQWSGTAPETPATTADELVTALGAQALRDASAPMDITLDGYAGKSITLHVPEDAVFEDCDESTFGSWTIRADLEPYRHQQGPGQIDEIWAVDVDGVLVVIDWTYYAGTPAEDVAELRAIVESATLE